MGLRAKRQRHWILSVLSTVRPPALRVASGHVLTVWKATFLTFFLAGKIFIFKPPPPCNQLQHTYSVQLLNRVFLLLSGRLHPWQRPPRFIRARVKALHSRKARMPRHDKESLILPMQSFLLRTLNSVWDTNPQAAPFSHTLHAAVLFSCSLCLFVYKDMQVHVKNTHVPDVPGRAKNHEIVGHFDPYPEFQHSRGWPEDDGFKASLDCMASSSPAWGIRWDSVSKQKWQSKIQPAKQKNPQQSLKKPTPDL